MKTFLLAALAVPALIITGVAAAAPDRPSNAPERVLVGFAGTPAAAERALVARHGGSVTADLSNVGALAVTLPANAAAALAREGAVRYVEPDEWRVPLGLETAELTPSLSNGLYGLITTKAVDAHPTYTGTGVKACVADTGLDFGHPDIAGNYLAGADFTGDGKGVRGDHWETHGTHVAGTVLGVRGNGQGVYGVAYGSKLVHARVLQNEGGYSSWIMNGVRWLVEQNGCHIVNMSLGGRSGSKTEERFYNDMRAKGALVVAATGNDSASTISYPARYPVNLAVGAVDVNNARASFSNTGTNIDLVAPGVGVLSSVPRGLGYDPSLTVGGTSYESAPLEYSGHTSGVTGPLVSCGKALSSNDCTGKPASGAWVALIERGDISFADKVNNATAAGARAAVIYNNASGGFSGTLGAPKAGGWIPALSVSREDGLAMLGSSDKATTLVARATDWGLMDGTSMATPHAAGVAALVWSAAAAAGKGPTPASVEDALVKTARDLGATGYDTSFGHGLAQADAAIAYAQDPPPVSGGNGNGNGKGGGKR
jgi:subtilisin family serine protease